MSSKRYKLPYASIENADQPVLLSSLIRVFDGHFLDSQRVNICIQLQIRCDIRVLACIQNFKKINSTFHTGIVHVNWNELCPAKGISCQPVLLRSLTSPMNTFRINRGTNFLSGKLRQFRMHMIRCSDWFELLDAHAKSYAMLGTRAKIDYLCLSMCYI